MANKKMKHVIAKLLGSATFETLDVYDEAALHSENIVNTGTTTAEGYALDARQANPDIEGTLANQISSLNDSLANYLKFTVTSSTEATNKSSDNHGFGFNINVTDPNGYSLLNHISTWCTGDANFMSSFDGPTYTTTVKIFIHNLYGNYITTNSNLVIHVLSLFTKNIS